MNHPIEGMLGVSMEKIREMVDVDTVIGKPIITQDGLTTVIPVSRVSFGFGSGGSDVPSKSEKELFIESKINVSSMLEILIGINPKILSFS